MPPCLLLRILLATLSNTRVLYLPSLPLFWGLSVIGGAFPPVALRSLGANVDTLSVWRCTYFIWYLFKDLDTCRILNWNNFPFIFIIFKPLALKSLTLFWFQKFYMKATFPALEVFKLSYNFTILNVTAMSLWVALFCLFSAHIWQALSIWKLTAFNYGIFS